ncbi:hypothetical protein O3G_MSEX005583 [Manduca sexta]|uniref:Uncharacterized protein n=1 Tax=Manduca sexta TaxID=7130 RepID=A0A922CJQ4_MANSE|nr:hypothetical protein O3G_MSEX005583 [Manduca sexta]
MIFKYTLLKQCPSGTLHYVEERATSGGREPCPANAVRTAAGPSAGRTMMVVFTSASHTLATHAARRRADKAAGGTSAERPRASRRPADRDWSVTARRSLGRRASRTNILDNAPDLRF